MLPDTLLDIFGPPGQSEQTLWGPSPTTPPPSRASSLQDSLLTIAPVVTPEPAYDLGSFLTSSHFATSPVAYGVPHWSAPEYQSAFPASLPRLMRQPAAMPYSLLESPRGVGLQGRVMNLALDKEGSRVLQKALAGCAPETVAIVVSEIAPHIQTVLCDTYANYMCQQLFVSTTAYQRLSLLIALGPYVVNVAKDRRGTHSLQALIGRVGTLDEQLVIAKIVSGRVSELALDGHATHVIQQVVECCLPQSRTLAFIIDEVTSNLRVLATDQFGLGLVKRCITHSETASAAGRLGAKLELYLSQFIEDPFANYAVQHALEIWAGAKSLTRVNNVETSPGKSAATSHVESAGLSSAIRMIDRMAEKISFMALHKFASNVAEVAIRVAEPAIRWRLINQFTMHRASVQENAFFSTLMKSPFAVFVVNTAIKFCDDPQQRDTLLSAVAKHLRKATEVKNKNKWDKVLQDNSETLSKLLFNNTVNNNSLTGEGMMWLPPGTSDS